MAVLGKMQDASAKIAEAFQKYLEESAAGATEQAKATLAELQVMLASVTTSMPVLVGEGKETLDDVQIALRELQLDAGRVTTAFEATMQQVREAIRYGKWHLQIDITMDRASGETKIAMDVERVLPKEVSPAKPGK